MLQCKLLGKYNRRKIYDYNEEGPPYDGYGLFHRVDVEFVAGEKVTMPKFVTHRELDEIMDTMSPSASGKVHHFSQWWLDKTEGRKHDCKND